MPSSLAMGSCLPPPIGGLDFNPITRTVMRGPITVILSPAEYETFFFLICNRSVSRHDAPFRHLGKGAFRSRINTLREKVERLGLEIPSHGEERYTCSEQSDVLR